MSEVESQKSSQDRGVGHMQKLADDSTLLQKSLTSDGKYLGGLTCHHLPPNPLPPSELGPGFRGETSGAKKGGSIFTMGGTCP